MALVKNQFSCLNVKIIKGFSQGPPVFFFRQMTSIQLIPTGCKLCSKVTYGLYNIPVVAAGGTIVCFWFWFNLAELRHCC